MSSTVRKMTSNDLEKMLGYPEGSLRPENLQPLPAGYKSPWSKKMKVRAFVRISDPDTYEFRIHGDKNYAVVEVGAHQEAREIAEEIAEAVNEFFKRESAETP